jgi:predicted GH43/DUF377 family glycosyl hydrolase
MKARIRRSALVLRPDRKRVMLRSFYPTSDESAQRIVDEVLALEEAEAARLWRQASRGFSGRHEDIERSLESRFEQLRGKLHMGKSLSEEQRRLIASYFLMEYSPESSALFNPSMVPHPDQSGLPSGSLRFILSLRATGEGHISSITFRSGVLDARNNIVLAKPYPFTLQAERRTSGGYVKELFQRKLMEAGVHDELSARAMASLPDVFILDELREVLRIERERLDPVDILVDRSCQAIALLAESNYEVHFNPASRLSQCILFPAAPSQSNGIEDARFVRFAEEDGSFRYYATYTAYDGKTTFPQLLETRDFLNFKFATLNGSAVRNKGMALFPRRINGKYAMLSRQDDESIFVMFSDNIDFWYEPRLVVSPARPWEYMKIGTCGSPIETDRGWLLVSHGVGPFRRYSIGAFLLDLEEPTRLVARLSEPLLVPQESERDGYVPNVVYSCGALVHSGELVIPYGVSDYATKFAVVGLDELLDAMEPA